MILTAPPPLPPAALTFLTARIGDDLIAAGNSHRVADHVAERLTTEALAKRALLALYRAARQDSVIAQRDVRETEFAPDFHALAAAADRESALREALYLALEVYYRHHEFDPGWTAHLPPLSGGQRML